MSILNADIINMQPPSIKAGCSINDMSFTMYKGTICNDRALSVFNPRCIELSIKEALGFDTSAAKFYTDKEAREYLKNLK